MARLGPLGDNVSGVAVRVSCATIDGTPSSREYWAKSLASNSSRNLEPKNFINPDDKASGHGSDAYSMANSGAWAKEIAKGRRLAF